MESTIENEKMDLAPGEEIGTLPEETSLPTSQNTVKGMDTKVLGLMVVVIILILSNVFFALAYLEEFDDDDDDEHENGEQPDRTQVIENITVFQAYSLMENNTNNPHLVILDVRIPDNYANGHIPRAVNIDFFNDTFEVFLSIFDKNLTYLVYCDGDGLSGLTIEIMKNMGFMEVYLILNGFTRWKELGYEVEEGNS